MNRVAIYIGAGGPKASRARIRRHFREAKSFGLRVVTVVQEGEGDAQTRPVLKDLEARLAGGDFEAILGVGHQAFGAWRAETANRTRQTLPPRGSRAMILARYSSVGTNLGQGAFVAAPGAAVEGVSFPHLLGDGR